jgi:hypothetical protein
MENQVPVTNGDSAAIYIAPRVGDDNRAYISFAVIRPGDTFTYGVALRPLRALKVLMSATFMSLFALVFRR